MDACKNIVGNRMEMEEVELASVSTRNLRSRRLKFSKRVNRTDRKMVSCPCHGQSNHKTSSLSTTNSDQEAISSIPCHAVFMFLDPLLLGMLQVEYQSKPKSPFETHPVHMWTFLMSICIYSTTLATKIYLKNQSSYYAEILSHVLLVAGSLSSASLVSIFLPRWLVWFLIIIWASILPVMMARHWLRFQLCRVFSRIMDSVSQAKKELNMLVERMINPVRQHQLPI